MDHTKKRGEYQGWFLLYIKMFEVGTKFSSISYYSIFPYIMDFCVVRVQKCVTHMLDHW
jgi:hypothetical protein